MEEIFQSIYIKQEKPHLPICLPSALENILRGCFEYDFTEHPLMVNLLEAFKRLMQLFNFGLTFLLIFVCLCSVTLVIAVDIDSTLVVLQFAGWRITNNTTAIVGLVLETGHWQIKVTGIGYTEWLPSKDQLQLGETVRSRKPPNSCKVENMNILEGTIVGLETDGCLLVRVHGIHDPMRIHSSILERVKLGLAAGDWVHAKKVNKKKHSPFGIFHSIQRDGTLAVGFLEWKPFGREIHQSSKWQNLTVGQFVKLKENILSHRFEWPQKRGNELFTGRISQTLPNGCLVVKFPDPAEVELVSFKTCTGVVKKYQHLEAFHWAVRPLIFSLGLFTAVRLGVLVGREVGKSKRKTDQTVSGSW
ncbi:hypothetical protein C5167_023750 [Papaver somniferum]|uniref:RING-type E3 ubiquitin transferase n=1 Tax=Papaver somniferum TaxID=3469 RepID=A0A4Y7JQP2_PAPSO|nr:hypothetical protein C5167_023750 [Papaver somniferum]